MATVVREIERKYDATGAGLPDLAGVPGVASVSADTRELLNAVYYDTADLRLIRAGITLRRRTGGDDAGWHLKLPAGADARDELRLPAGRAGGRVPAELASLVRATTRGATIAPVVRMRTVRRRRHLLDGAGAPLAEIAADEVSAELADGSGAQAWTELEVELMAGGRELLAELDRRLRAAGVRPAAVGSKLARVLAARLTAVGAPPGQDAPAAHAGRPPAPGSPAGEIVLAYLASQVHAITANDPLVRRDEPDAVHQMRVATRRARSALQAFGKLVQPGRARPLGRELKWLATVLGRARDAEVTLARFDECLAGGAALPGAEPARARLIGHFTAELGQARSALLRALDGPRYLGLLDDLDAFLDDPPYTRRAARPAAGVLPAQVRRVARGLERALAGIGQPATGSETDAARRDAALHEARKAAKRARYAADAAEPALGQRAARLARRAKKLQELLGEHHDSVVARQQLRDLSADAHAAAESTFTYGVLHEREARRAAEAERLARRQLTRRRWW
jgi:CHAD domain-containing protein